MRTAADAVDRARRILDREGDEGDTTTGGQAGDSETKVLTNSWNPRYAVSTAVFVAMRSATLTGVIAQQS